MLTDPVEILVAFPVRKSQKQKQAFRDAVQSYVSALGYSCTLETGSFGRRNLVIGSPEQAEYLITAGKEGAAVVTLLEIARTFPQNQWHKVCFVLLESARSYQSAHKTETDRQLVLHLDCVRSGNEIQMIPTKALQKDRRKLTSLYKACGYFGKKSLLLDEKHPFSSVFPYAVNICTNPSKRTGDDRTSLDKTNINILRAALTTYICCDAAQ